MPPAISLIVTGTAEAPYRVRQNAEATYVCISEETEP